MDVACVKPSVIYRLSEKFNFFVIFSLNFDSVPPLYFSAYASISYEFSVQFDAVCR